ncbi:apyrase-like [Anopheles funestus]|uniref:apyrase-like n=1 Tax=Anopheles funestus TaxID=62324 RepID=UPI0020C5D6D7|nr:apyrase-like [Anopheles funestus]XP_049301120.1 apyrase-like [Anopheles funestus]
MRKPSAMIPFGWLVNFCVLFVVTSCTVLPQTLGSAAGSSGVVITRQALHSDLFPLTIIHLNDFHARFEETNTVSTRCKVDEGERCIGGYARVVTRVKSLQREYADRNPIYLNAGDSFQGTLWYSLLRWNVTAHFLNLLPADVMTLGNHEFEHGIAGLVPFLDVIESPVVVANIDDREEPTMQGKYTKSVVLDRGGRKIGVIGVIHHLTNTMGMTERVRFLDEVDQLRLEIDRLKDAGIQHIVVLSHCGLEIDRTIARELPDVDVIVGGHSHTFLYNGTTDPFPDEAEDTYPVVVEHPGGQTTLIVQAASYAKYVGRITLYFDGEGNVREWEGNPEFLDDTVPQDPEILRQLVPWRELVSVQANRQIGYSAVLLAKPDCARGECNFGNFITDGYIDYFATEGQKSPNSDQWTEVAIAFNTGGGMRTSLFAGNLTFDDLVTAVPFEDTVDSFDLQGRVLLEALEHSASRYGTSDMMQMSGMKVTYDLRRPVGNRVVSVSLRCRFCQVPQYEPLDPERVYRVATGAYIRKGGSGYTMIPQWATNLLIGPVDIAVLERYVQKMTPIISGTDGRITVIE